MRAQVVLLAAAVLAASAACSSGGGADATSPAPHLPATSSVASSAGSPGTGAVTSAAPAGANVDPDALLAAQKQLTGCQAALVPIFDAFRNGTWGTDAPHALAATPEPARSAMQQAIDYYKQILASDPNANEDGEGSKAAKYLAAFCSTPDGAKLVGTTPVDALRPVKRSRR